MVDMVDYKYITCNFKSVSFHYTDEQKALYCKSCKLVDMIDMSHNKCITCNKKRPCSKYPNEN